jgi:FKBP-type peptidyl-prolyl cis-trans isomerase FklB|tara:strand:+ start:209 stop:757 length:549 start_codon:yes stop_codon:yes gene_type:complete
VTLASGLQYKVLRKGDGSFYPTKDSSCECHYEGTLIDGTEFDSSYARGTPTSFAPNQVISGWTEAMQLMVEGDKWEMYIPSDMAYGERGSPPKIPGGSALIFRMEIIKIKGDKVAANRCDVATLEGCDEKETKYIAKQAGWDAAKRDAQIKRLQKMSGNKMKPELQSWMAKRLAILTSAASA